MKIKFLFLLLIGTTAQAGFAQIEQDTIAVDSTMAEPPPIEYDYDTYEGDWAMPAVEAAPEAPKTYYNRFLYSEVQGKFESEVDKKAIYKSGISGMYEEIRQYLEVPYIYGEESKYVIIEVTIGTDSMMYNPKVVYTDGGRYTENAKDALEQLSLRFIPAKKRGKNVASTLLIPIRFEPYTYNSKY